MYVLGLQTCTVWFLSLFSEGLMCIRQNLKLLCCAAYILNLIVSICLSCWPNLWCSGVFSAEFRSFRKNSAKPDISRKYGSASRIFWKIRLRGLLVHHHHPALLHRHTLILDRSVTFLMEFFTLVLKSSFLKVDHSHLSLAQIHLLEFDHLVFAAGCQCFWVHYNTVTVYWLNYWPHYQTYLLQLVILTQILRRRTRIPKI